MKKLNIQYLFFISFLIIGNASLITSNTIMRRNNSYGFIVYLTILIFLLILTFLFNKANLSIKTILKSYVLRTILLLYFIISSFLIIIAFIKLTNDYFYRLTSPLIFLALFLGISQLLSSYGIKNIISIGFIMSILCLFLKLITITSSTKFSFSSIDFNTISNFDFLNSIGYIFCFLDFFIIPLFICEKQNNKCNYFIIIILVIVNTYLILENYLFFDSEYFLNAKYPYISKYLVYKHNRFIEHYDLFYLIITSIYFIFRLGTIFYIMRILLKQKANKYTNLIIPISLFIITYIIDFLEFSIDTIYYLMITSTILVLIYLLLVYIKKWRIKYEKNH